MEQLLSENKLCFDCNKNPIRSVSIQNAIFICNNCRIYHEIYGKEISDVKYIYEISNEHDLILLKLGGNRRLSTLLEVNNIDPKTRKIDIYFSKLIDYYRQILKWEAKKQKQLKNPPIDDELMEPCDLIAKSSAEKQIQILESQHNQEESQNSKNSEENLSWEEVGKSVDIYLSSTLEKTREYANQINESQDVQNFKKNSSFVMQQVKNLGEDLIIKVHDYSNKKKDIYESEGIKNALKSTGSDIKKTAVKGLNYLKDLWIKTEVVKQEDPASGFVHVDIQTLPMKDDPDQVQDINNIGIFLDKDSKGET